MVRYAVTWGLYFGLFLTYPTPFRYQIWICKIWGWKLLKMYRTDLLFYCLYAYSFWCLKVLVPIDLYRNNITSLSKYHCVLLKKRNVQVRQHNNLL